MNYYFEIIKENLTITVVIVSIILNVFYDILKRIIFTGISYSAAKTSRWALRKAEFLLEHYQDERILIKRISQRDGAELLKILQNTYNSILLGVLITAVLSFVGYFDNLILFYSFLGASATMIFQIVRDLYYIFRLMQKAKRLDYYLEKIDMKIKRIDNLINLKKGKIQEEKK